LDIAGTRLVLSIYTIDGRRVATLVDGIAQPGYKTVTWNGNTAAGKATASGMYFYKTLVKDRSGKEVYCKTRKMLLVK
jgi:flagellar hook assembly protein FlgD